MSTDAPIETATGRPSEAPAAPKDYFGLEVVAVLGVSFGLEGLKALLDLIYSQLVINRGFGLKHVATAPIKSSNTPQYPWLDIAYQLVSILQGLAPAFLAIVLLMRSPAGRGLGIGLDRLGWRELGVGAGFAALIGIPGLGLVYGARQLGLNAQIVVTSFPDVWYRVPTLLLEAFQQGIAEEVVICAFLLVRFKQLGRTNSRALVVASVARGSYHLYQGYGGFVGNAVMGLIFGWWFQRTKRVWPLVIAHGIIDAVSFIGYVYLAGRYSWI